MVSIPADQDRVHHGRELLGEAKAEHGESARHLYETKHSVASMTFNSLLEDVYERYPEYATESLFRPSGLSPER